MHGQLTTSANHSHPLLRRGVARLWNFGMIPYRVFMVDIPDQEKQQPKDVMLKLLSRLPSTFIQV